MERLDLLPPPPRVPRLGRLVLPPPIHRLGRLVLPPLIHLLPLLHRALWPLAVLAPHLPALAVTWIAMTTSLTSLRSRALPQVCTRTSGGGSSCAAPPTC